MENMKLVLGFIILMFMGFVFLVCCYSLGMMSALLIHTLPWWQLIGGTIIGMLAVIAHLLDN